MFFLLPLLTVRALFSRFFSADRLPCRMHVTVARTAVIGGSCRLAFMSGGIFNNKQRVVPFVRVLYYGTTVLRAIIDGRSISRLCKLSSKLSFYGISSFYRSTAKYCRVMQSLSTVSGIHGMHSGLRSCNVSLYGTWEPYHVRDGGCLGASFTMFAWLQHVVLSSWVW